MSVWTGLISQLQELNNVASLIQFDEDDELFITLNDNEINNFAHSYLEWYTECLSLLPLDLQESFRAEYEKYIKHFLLDLKSQSCEPIYHEGEFYGNGPPHFIYSYKAYFSVPSFTQKLVLMEASKRAALMPVNQKSLDAITTIELIGKRFDIVARQLRNRYNHRNTLIISDEYDVQNLFHALLKVFFDDIRSEEWTPSYAGSSSRIDFLLKKEEVVIEIKKTRSSLGAKEVTDELIIDKERYRSHPMCKTLIAFIYDPDKYINNPKGLDDLNETNDGMITKVIINQG